MNNYKKFAKGGVGLIITEGISTNEYVSPSGINGLNKKHGIAMSQNKILKTTDEFVQSAKNAKKAGFDGIEIHGGHGYLVDQFFWNVTNKRKDKYGGSIKKRTRFAVEIIKSIKKKCGENFIICLRFSQRKIGHKNAKIAKNKKELKDFLNPLKNSGVDMFHCSCEDYRKPEYKNIKLTISDWTKKITNSICIANGSIFINKTVSETGVAAQFEDAQWCDNLEPINKAIKSKKYDLISIGRALLADPELIKKIMQNKKHLINNFNDKLPEIQVYYKNSPILKELKVKKRLTKKTFSKEFNKQIKVNIKANTTLKNNYSNSLKNN